MEQIKHLEEQLEKHIKELTIVIDKYCDILESPEQHDIMNECFLEQNARVLNHRGCSQMGGGGGGGAKRPLSLKSVTHIL